jgi:hypothetical protein
MALSFSDVNKRGSYTWIKCNDDARSSYFRDSFISKHGGKFIKSGRYWEWTPSNDQIIFLEPIYIKPAEKTSSKSGEKVWVFQKDSTVYETKNLQEFCKQHDLTRSSLYEVISGKRKFHKGYFLVEIVEK